MRALNYGQWTFLLAAGLLTSYGPVSADMIQPFDYFSVYSLGNIGTADKRFQATFHGPAGAAGNADLRSSKIISSSEKSGILYSSEKSDSLVSPTTISALEASRDGLISLSKVPVYPGRADGYALHVGGDLTAQYSTTFGEKVESGGDVRINGVTISADIHAGGNISDYGYNGATITGSAYAGEAVKFSDRVSVEATYSNVSFLPLIDHKAVSAYYLDTSAILGNMAATGRATGTGGLVFKAGSGINVVDIDQETLRSAWGFTINAPEDALVIINVPNHSVVLDNTTWVYQGGITQESVILNMPHASSLTLSQTNKVNILAPMAATDFLQGNVDGLLVAGDLSGGGHVMGGTFNAHAIPEPTTVVLLALGGLMLLWPRRSLGR